MSTSFSSDGPLKNFSAAGILDVSSAVKTDVNCLLNTSAISIESVTSLQFSSVFTAEDVSNIPAAAKFFKGPSEEELVDIKITAQLVRKKLQELRADKSPGDDDMSPRLLKEIVDEIAHPVAKLFSQSLEEGRVPLDWRTANVTPIFKRAAEISQ